MFRKSFKARIIFPTVAVLAALVVVLNIFLSLRFSALRDSLVEEKVIADISSGMDKLNSLVKALTAPSVLMKSRA